MWWHLICLPPAKSLAGQLRWHEEPRGTDVGMREHGHKKWRQMERQIDKRASKQGGNAIHKKETWPATSSVFPGSMGSGSFKDYTHTHTPDLMQACQVKQWWYIHFAAFLPSLALCPITRIRLIRYERWNCMACKYTLDHKGETLVQECFQEIAFLAMLDSRMLTSTPRGPRDASCLQLITLRFGGAFLAIQMHQRSFHRCVHHAPLISEEVEAGLSSLSFLIFGCQQSTNPVGQLLLSSFELWRREEGNRVTHLYL